MPSSMRHAPFLYNMSKTAMSTTMTSPTQPCSSTSDRPLHPLHSESLHLIYVPVHRPMEPHDAPHHSHCSYNYFRLFCSRVQQEADFLATASQVLFRCHGICEQGGQADMCRAPAHLQLLALPFSVSSNFVIRFGAVVAQGCSCNSMFVTYVAQQRGFTAKTLAVGMSLLTAKHESKRPFFVVL